MHAVSIFKTNVVVQLLEAAIKQLPYGVLSNFGNQWKYDGRHLNLSGSQIEPFTELNMGLDNIIDRFRTDFVCGVTSIRASQGYTQHSKTSFMVIFFYR